MIKSLLKLKKKKNYTTTEKSIWFASFGILNKRLFNETRHVTDYFMVFVRCLHITKDTDN